MELRDLRIFVCVVDERSFSAAGRRLHLAQSGVSDGVARLERELGARLLERGRSGSSPTAQGAVLLRWARRLISSADRAREEVRAAERGSAPTIRAGFLPTITPLVLPGFLAGIRALPAPASVRVTEGLAPPLLEQVRDGRLDLAVIFFPADEVPGVEFVEVGERPLCVIVEGDVELARRRSVPLSTLSRHEWVTFPPHNPGRMWLDTACAAAGFVPRIAAEVETPVQQRIFVEAGIGVAMVPMGGAVALHAAPGVAEVRLEGPLPRFRIGYGHSPEQAGPGTDTARRVLESVLDRLEPDGGGFETPRRKRSLVVDRSEAVATMRQAGSTKRGDRG
ncbi:MAG: LysR family transcriptional regulator [Acidimicrobiales bacterium]